MTNPATEHQPTSSPAAKIQEATEARDALASALTRAGIQLPAMDVRTPWADDSDTTAPYALVHLGVCSAPVAHALAAAIAKGFLDPPSA
ncbi:hypothetical protein [Streptomyces sp. BH104]|uniref:hypothetical protein n=1 Tax=Streptomyces sp. BH104 TaxID=3410407 RepID=UPI003BB75B4B